MEPGWYQDPLDRFYGRFFDGERWTSRVSDGARLTTDPEFALGLILPVTPGARRVDPPPGATPVPGDPSPTFENSAEPAVAGLNTAVTQQADTLVESPTRTVAVLKDFERGPRANASSGFKRWGLVALLTALAVVVIGAVVLFGGATTESVAELDESQEDRVRDLESGGVEEVDGEDLGIEELVEADQERLEAQDPLARATSPNTAFEVQDGLNVGALQIINGVPMLRELSAWHADFSAAAQRDLVEGSGCWLGQLGGAAVQEAHCGPVGIAEGDFLFDLVPVVFQDVGGAQLAVPLLDSVVFDAVKANALESVGTAENPFTFDPAE